MKSTTGIKYVGIAGNIGAGKTTLCSQLGKHFDWDVNFESTDDNPYLSDFYHDMSRWSFNLQVYFLHNRYKQVLNILAGDRVVVQDRTIYEDANIFAPNLHKMGLMSKRDFDNYQDLFDLMISQIQEPDLMIYLRASIATLVEHIQSRGRDYEGNMSIEYLKRLNGMYEEWIGGYKGKLLIIKVDDLDFKNNPEEFRKDFKSGSRGATWIILVKLNIQKIRPIRYRIGLIFSKFYKLELSFKMERNCKSS